MSKENRNDRPSHPASLDLYTVAETAAILNVSQKTVLEWIKNKDLQATRLGPGQRLIRICRVDLEAFVHRDFQGPEPG